MRGRARRWGAACRVGVGWERRLSSAFPPAPPRLHPRPGTTLAPRPVASSPVSLFRPTSPPRSFEVGSEGSGRGRGCSARPHPTPRSFARGAGHDCLLPGRGPHGADPPVASRGLCGLTGGGSPPRGRLLARRLRPLALDWSASAGRRLLWACRAVARRLPTPSEPRGFVPSTPPAAFCPVLSPSRPFTSVVSPTSLAPRFPSEPSLCPRWWGSRGEGAWERGHG